MADKPNNKGGRPPNGRGRRVSSVYANDQELELLRLAKSLPVDRTVQLIAACNKWLGVKGDA